MEPVTVDIVKVMPVPDSVLECGDCRREELELGVTLVDLCPKHWAQEVK
jgi:hypothetical protein